MSDYAKIVEGFISRGQNSPSAFIKFDPDNLGALRDLGITEEKLGALSEAIKSVKAKSDKTESCPDIYILKTPTPTIGDPASVSQMSRNLNQNASYLSHPRSENDGEFVSLGLDFLKNTPPQFYGAILAHEILGHDALNHGRNPDPAAIKAAEFEADKAAADHGFRELLVEYFDHLQKNVPDRGSNPIIAERRAALSGGKSR